MGQIFDRISRIVKSGTNKSDNDYNYSFNRNNDYLSEEDELKNIIDNLNNNNNQNKHNSNNSYQSNYSSFDAERAYSTLKIDSNSSIDEIKTAYKNRIKEYHPDKTAGLGEEVQKIAQLKTQELNEAYSILKKLRNF